jgi:hypothetical protein
MPPVAAASLKQAGYVPETIRTVKSDAYSDLHNGIPGEPSRIGDSIKHWGRTTPIKQKLCSHWDE